MNSAAVRSKAVVLLLFIPCLLFLPLFVGFCVGSLFSCSVLCVLSSFAITQLGKRELVALLVSKCVLNAMSLLSFFDSSSRCRGLVCGMLS